MISENRIIELLKEGESSDNNFIQNMLYGSGGILPCPFNDPHNTILVFPSIGKTCIYIREEVIPNSEHERDVIMKKILERCRYLIDIIDEMVNDGRLKKKEHESCCSPFDNTDYVLVEGMAIDLQKKMYDLKATSFMF